MARQIVVELVGDNRKLTKTLDSATGSANKFGSGFNKVSTLVAAGSALLGSAVVMMATNVFRAGASFEAMDAKAQTVFGDHLPVVRKWSKESAAAMGLTERSAIGLAANFGDLLVPMGFTRDVAAQMSTKVIGLSGALSEWSGGQQSAADVAVVLQKAMLGEREGLKTLGISITEADVSQRLLAKGQNKLTGSALAQAKALATQELLFEKSTDAQDAYAKGTAKGIRSQREMEAAVGEAGEALIETLYPALAGVAEIVKDTVVPLSRLLVDNMGTLLPLAGAVGAAIMIKLVPALIAMGARAALSLGPIGLLVMGIAAIGIAIGRAADTTVSEADKIRETLAQEGLFAPPEQVKEQLRKRLSELEIEYSVAQQNFKTQIDKMRTDWEKSQLGRAVTGATERIAEGLKSGEIVVRDGALVLASQLPEALAAAKAASVAIVTTIPGAIAAGMRSKRSEWQEAVALLGTDLENEMTRQQEIAAIQAALVGPEIAAGLKSGDPIVQFQAKETVRILTERLGVLKAVGRDGGANAGQGLADGLSSKTGVVAKAAARLAIPVARYLKLMSPAEIGPLSKLGGPEGWGERGGALYSKGWKSSLKEMNLGQALMPPGRLGGGGSGGGPSIVINIASFTGSDRDIDQFADRLAMRLRLAGV